MGTWIFLSRVDDQVKMRGYRIEIGEIEKQLQSHVNVDEAGTVLLREDVPGQSSLVAYLTSKVNELEKDILKDHLEKGLPGYIIPACYVWLNVFPKLPNGKIDRRALPVPEMDDKTTFVAPRTDLEEHLAGLWRELLGKQEISVTANFFDLGGNSLIGATLVNRLQEQLGEYIYLIAVFDAPTISSLASYLQENYPESVSRLIGEDMTEMIRMQANTGTPDRLLALKKSSHSCRSNPMDQNRRCSWPILPEELSSPITT